MIPQELIEKALQLTGKSIEDMRIEVPTRKSQFKDALYTYEFYYPKFFYYLLSPEFIDKYGNQFTDYPKWENTYDIVASNFGKAIHKYQSGNEIPLIELLKKI